MTEQKTHFSIPAYNLHMKHLEKKQALNKFGIALIDTLKEIIITHTLLHPEDKDRLDISISPGPNWKPIAVKFSVCKSDDYDDPQYLKDIQIRLDGFFQDLDNMFSQVYSNEECDNDDTPKIYAQSRLYVLTFPNPWETLTFIGDYLEYFSAFITPDQVDVEVNYDEKNLEFQPLSERHFVALPLTQIATRNMILDFAKAMGAQKEHHVLNICPGYLEGCLEEAYKHVPPANMFNIIH
ncbi:MAG: hypothetical protein RBR86_07025 [Pseudobdellovibrionaceae bacterium]|jgi:hypothetical protein|nr:hypothetical protein [Pseudobdellovibrionaceae bacterium]